MSKTLFLSKPYGFCSGVKKALNIVEQVLHKYPAQNIYIFNEIVHNKTIVEDLTRKGVIFTKDLSKIPEHAIVILSAHGVPPQVRKTLASKNAVIYDATCPLVQKVHAEVINYTKKGYHLIYIGNKNHDEAQGVIAENPENISIVENEKDIPNIKKGFVKYMVLTQTTLNMFEVAELLKKIKKEIPRLGSPDKKDLCYTTTSRQLAVKENAQRCDLFLIVGSKNSSNSKKLKEIASEYCPAYLIDNYQEIDQQWLNNATSVCLTSGASAPDHLLEEIIAKLREQGFLYKQH